MKRKLIATLGISLAVIALSEDADYSSRHANDLSTNGALRLSILEPQLATNPPTALQIEARAFLLSINPTFPDSGVQNDKMARVVNSGGGRIMFAGFNRLSPGYRIEAKRHGERIVVPLDVPLIDGRQFPILYSMQSIDFPVIAPDGFDSWRIGIVYHETFKSTKLRGLVDFGLNLLHQPPLNEGRSFIVWSNEVRK